MYMNNFGQQVLPMGMPRFGLPRIVYISSSEQQVLRYPGSMLKAKSQGLWPDHLGILGEPLPDGRWSVVHSTERGVVLTSLEEFGLGRSVEVTDEPWTLEHQRAILGRAYSQIGHPYDVLLANCEHFARWAFYGVPESPQLRAYALGASLLGIGLLVLRSLSGGRSRPLV